MILLVFLTLPLELTFLKVSVSVLFLGGGIGWLGGRDGAIGWLGGRDGAIGWLYRRDGAIGWLGRRDGAIGWLGGRDGGGADGLFALSF